MLTRRRQAYDAVTTGLLSRHGLHRHQGVAGGFEAPHHLLGAPGAVAIDEVVGEKDRERLVADRRPRAQHRVTEPERRRLANIQARHVTRENRTHTRQQFVLPLRFERGLELRRTIEVILDRLLGVSGDEHEMLDPGRDCFLHRVLDERLVDDREHLLRKRLRRRQEPGTETRHRKDRLSNPDRHCLASSIGDTSPPPAIRERRAFFAAAGSSYTKHRAYMSHRWRDRRHARPTHVYSNPSARIGSGS